MRIPVRIVRMLSGTRSLRNALPGDAYHLLEIPGTGHINSMGIPAVRGRGREG